MKLRRVQKWPPLTPNFFMGMFEQEALAAAPRSPDLVALHR